MNDLPSDRKKRALIIGAGLGGLLTGAFLATHGWQVTFLEALSLIGGRFTHIEYEGFAVPTGAFHALPGGNNGPLARCLRALDLQVPLIEVSPSFMVMLDGKAYPLDIGRDRIKHSGLRRDLGFTSELRLFLRFLSFAVSGQLPEKSVADLLRGLAPDDRTFRLFDHLTKFSVGVGAEEAAAADIARSLQAQRFSREALLGRGNRSLVTALLEQAQQHGAELRLMTPVRHILVTRGRATGIVTTDGEQIDASLIISNAGARHTATLLGDAAPEAFRRKASQAIPAFGAAHAIRRRRPLHTHASIEIPVDLPSIAGIVPVSHIAPDLCPPGWHYSLAYQPLSGEQFEDELRAAQGELRHHLGDDIDIFNTALYRGDYPAAYLAQRVGQHGRRRFSASIPGIAGLYLVGQDIAGYGIAAEIIGSSSLALWKQLEKFPTQTNGEAD